MQERARERELFAFTFARNRARSSRSDVCRVTGSLPLGRVPEVMSDARPKKGKSGTGGECARALNVSRNRMEKSCRRDGGRVGQKSEEEE